MGLILERSGMAEDLLDTIGQLFGPIRGGLAYAVILVGAMLAATTGVVAASVISMGLISLPIMLRYGYDRRLASGVIAASGTLAQIIPPSLVLIVLADQLGRSVGDLYKGAFIPGFVLTGLYIFYVLIVSIARPQLGAGAADGGAHDPRGRRHAGPALAAACSCSAVAARDRLREDPAGDDPDRRADRRLDVRRRRRRVRARGRSTASLKLGLLSRMAERVTFVLIPPLALIFLVLGTIFLGVATPTEGGAMGAVGALVMALARRRIDLKLLRQAMDTTMKISSFVLFILIGSTVFSLSFQAVDGPVWVEHLLTSLPGGQLGFLIVVNILIFFLAFFLDFFELSFIVIPLIAPVADKLGIDLVWFGVLLAVNMQTSFMHPPFGFALFYLRSVAPSDDYDDKITAQADRRGHDRPDLLGRGAVRHHPDRHGRPDHRLPDAGLERPRQGADGRRRQGVPADADAPKEPRADAPARRRATPAPPAPASPRRRRAGAAEQSSDDDAMKRLLESMQARSDEEALTAPTRDGRARKKNPAAAGFSFERARAGVDQSFCACMKSSKPASVKRNQRFASRRQCREVGVDLLPVGVARAQLAVDVAGGLERAAPSCPSGSGTAWCPGRPASSAPPDCGSRTWRACRRGRATPPPRPSPCTRPTGPPRPCC